MPKKFPIEAAEDTAWRWFSRWIRISDPTVVRNGNDLFAQCYTTKKYYNLLELQAGHYQTQGGHNATKFDEENVRPQCVYANKHLHGMRSEFCDYLKKELGTKKFNAMILRSNQYCKRSLEEFKAIAKKYRNLVREKEKELGIKIW